MIFVTLKNYQHLSVSMSNELNCIFNKVEMIEVLIYI